MERKIRINPFHLKHLGLPEDTRGIIGIDTRNCPIDCENLKTNAKGEKACKAVIIYTPEPITHLKIKPKS